MKRRILIRSHRSLAAAVLAALVASTAADAAYWNRGRNRRGSTDDAGSVSSSNSNHASNGRRGRDLDRDGVPNLVDPDVDNDGVANGADSNVDGGVVTTGSKAGKYIGDRLPNDHPGERDIDDDGLLNASDSDVDGDGAANGDDTDDDGDGRLDDVDAAPLGASKLTPPPAGGGGPVGDGQAPAALVGLVYVIREKSGSIEANLNFTSATNGAETDPDGDNDGFAYSYAPTGTTAALRLQFKTDKWDEYDLDYATGAYVRREFDKNALKDTDTGVFGLEGATPPPPPPPAGGGTGGVVGDGTAPAALDGVTWVVRQMNGKIEANLLFATATAGSENDPDGDIDSFTYEYAANAGLATLRLTFKLGKWDEYDLNFATGFYTRREFKNGALDDTDTGFFGVPAVTPPAVGGGAEPPVGGGNDDGTPDQGSGDN